MTKNNPSVENKKTKSSQMKRGAGKRAKRRISRRDAIDAAARLKTDAQGNRYVIRFSLAERIEHILLIISFTMLGITGLLQRYASGAIGSLLLRAMGGIEIARQLRLRDLSGLIVIDFIDMREQENQRKVYNELRSELKKDRAKVAVSPISEFGLLEMTRQRIRQSLLDSMTEECPTCHGAGQIISKETLITRIDHWLRRYKSKRRSLRLKLLLHPEIEAFLRVHKKKALRGLMWKNFVHIKIEANPEIHRDQFEFITLKDGKNVTNALEKDNSKT